MLFLLALTLQVPAIEGTRAPSSIVCTWRVRVVFALDSPVLDFLGQSTASSVGSLSSGLKGSTRAFAMAHVLCCGVWDLELWA